MKVLSDASPLISLAGIGHREVLPKLYSKITITGQVYGEVVVCWCGVGRRISSGSGFVE